MALPDPQKTEPATAKKRRDERKKGNVFLSNDAVSVAVMLSGFFVIWLTGTTIVEQFGSFLHYSIGNVAAAGIGDTQGFLSEYFMRMLYALAFSVGPIFATCVLVAISVTFAQTNFLFALDSIKPKFSKLNPIEGVKKLFSLKSIVDAIKGIFKIGILLYLIFNYLINVVDVFVKYLYTDLAVACSHLFNEAFMLVIQVSIAFIVLAGFDFFYQRWEYERNIKMSKQEIKDEYKQIEGDPKVKGKIKQMQRSLAKSRMMQQVPHADVIIKNPTHFAVALRYKADKDNAPIVLAKGQDEMAMRILRVAQEHGITVVENVQLARALYATSELNREIPSQLYDAVAQVLVYLYKLKGKIK